MLKKTAYLLSTILMISTISLPAVSLALPVDAPAGGTLQQRITQRTSEQAVKLTDKELSRLKGRCTTTQNTIRILQTNLGPIVDNRQSTYKRIDAKLWIAIGQLKLADKDTFNLEKQRAELANKVAAYDSTVDQYKQTLDDIVSINCEADLNGFIALVKTARDYHDLLRKQSADIRSYVVDTVKKTLTNFATDLEPKPTSTDKAN